MYEYMRECIRYKYLYESTISRDVPVRVTMHEYVTYASTASILYDDSSFYFYALVARERRENDSQNNCGYMRFSNNVIPTATSTYILPYTYRAHVQYEMSTVAA